MKTINLFSLLILYSLFYFTTFSKKSIPNIVEIKNNLSKIKEALLTNKFKHDAYEQVAYLVDTYGPRLYGTRSLELALNYMESLLKKSKFENVKQELVPNVPVWRRGKEKLTLFSPRVIPTPVPLIGLGGSVGGNVFAEVIVIQSFDDLKAKKDQIKGKIVLFNHKWTNYFKEVKYRMRGAIKAAKYGAVGVLIRSLATKSIESPHTGIME